MNKRPVSITVVSLLFIVVGGGGLIKALWPLVASGKAGITGHELIDSVLVFVSGLMALVSGVFMLRRANWARWLLVVWLAFHVVISLGHETSQLIVHSLLMIVVVFILFWPSASAYFRRKT